MCQDFLWIKTPEDDVMNNNQDESREIVPITSITSGQSFMSLHIEEFK